LQPSNLIGICRKYCGDQVFSTRRGAWLSLWSGAARLRLDRPAAVHSYRCQDATKGLPRGRRERGNAALRITVARPCGRKPWRDLFPPTGRITTLETKDSDWEKSFGVNVFGTLKVIRRFIKPMIEQLMK